MLCTHIQIQIYTFTPIGKWMEKLKEKTKTQPKTDIHTVETTFEYCGHYTHIWFSLHTFEVKMNFQEPIETLLILTLTHAIANRRIHLEILDTSPNQMIQPDTQLAYLRINSNCSLMSAFFHQTMMIK